MGEREKKKNKKKRQKKAKEKKKSCVSLETRIANRSAGDDGRNEQPRRSAGRSRRGSAAPPPRGAGGEGIAAGARHGAAAPRCGGGIGSGSLLRDLAVTPGRGAAVALSEPGAPGATGRGGHRPGVAAEKRRGGGGGRRCPAFKETVSARGAAAGGTRRGGRGGGAGRAGRCPGVRRGRRAAGSGGVGWGGESRPPARAHFSAIPGGEVKEVCFLVRRAGLRYFCCLFCFGFFFFTIISFSRSRGLFGGGLFFLLSFFYSPPTPPFLPITFFARTHTHTRALSQPIRPGGAERGR